VLQVEGTGGDFFSAERGCLQGTIDLSNPVRGIGQLTLDVAGNHQLPARITVNDGKVFVTLEDFFYIFF
jgi:hypothetical protein